MSSPVDCDGPLTYVTLMTSDDFLMVLRACFNSSQWPWFQFKNVKDAFTLMSLTYILYMFICGARPQNKNSWAPATWYPSGIHRKAVQTLASSLRASDTKHLPLLVPFLHIRACLFGSQTLKVVQVFGRALSWHHGCISHIVSVALARCQLKGNSSNSWT